MTDEPPSRHISVPEAARRLGIAKSRVYQLIDTGRLAAIHRGERIWVPERAVRERLGRIAKLRADDCVSSGEVAAFFGVDPKTVRGWYNNGLLRATKVQHRLCFDPLVVARFRPPTTRGPRGRLPKRTPTRTLRGRYYPAPGKEDANNGTSEHQQPHG